MSMMWMRWNTGPHMFGYYIYCVSTSRQNVETKRSALEIGAFLSIFMFGAVTMQGRVYYQNCKDDSKWLPQSCFLNSATQSQPLALFGGPLSQSLIWSSNQAYYIDRVRRLSSKWWLAIIGWLLTVINFGASLMVTYETFRDVPREPNNFELQREWGWLITLNLGLDALVDVFIAAALVYQLRQLSMPVHASPMKNSAKMLNELLLWTIETGLLTR
ncbi:hypothetical protein C8R41DRAFT_826443 [Lentinula lateritia]|uniref:Uncharacterized protein n=1 Tax=Lentinula lateritia TaxID=40482 RepID=A0ABQ8VPB8_9AGAR|nr:hypothetical protein C8R41DRAFT_826443 [Lentinula lateritia]